MTHLVVSLFEDPNEAREMKNSLQQAGFNHANVEFIEADPENQSFFKRVFSDEGDEEMKAEQALEYMTGLGVPEDEADDYANKVKKGQSLLVVRCESDAEIERAHEVLNAPLHRSHDKSTAGPPLGKQDSPMGEPAAEMKEPAEGEEHIQASEEELHVGKRREETGGVRVTKEITEEEVEQDIWLEQEEVEVQRRNVDRPLREGEQAFEEQEIEVSESREEPMIEKESRVREEVTVTKETEAHPETIRETVRKEHIDIEDLTQRTKPRFDQFESQLRTHYQENFADGDHDFDDYSRGYQYGMALAESEKHRAHDWNDIEDDAGRHWEAQESTRWDDFKDAVRYGFHQIRGRDEKHQPRP